MLTLPATAAQFFATPNALGGTVTFGGDGRVVNPPVTDARRSTTILEGPVGARTPNQITIQRRHERPRRGRDADGDWQ